MNDLISRQAAIDELNVLCQEHRYRIPGKRETYSEYNEAWQDALDRAEGAIFNLPSAQPERKGKWICKYFPASIGSKVLVEVNICSNCGCVVEGNNVSNFCPVCGSDMRGER